MKQAELEAEFHNRRPEDAALRLTKLSEAQLRLAETVFLKLDEDEDVVIAVGYWKRHGRRPLAHALKGGVARRTVGLAAYSCPSCFRHLGFSAFGI